MQDCTCCHAHKEPIDHQTTILQYHADHMDLVCLLLQLRICLAERAVAEHVIIASCYQFSAKVIIPN
jgi:hypothetical protein